MSDKNAVDELVANARRLLDTAVAAAESGPGACAYTVFIGPHGGLQMIAGDSVPAAAVAWSYGAREAWHISSHGSKVRVDAQGAAGRCILEQKTEHPGTRLLNDSRLYYLERE